MTFLTLEEVLHFLELFVVAVFYIEAYVKIWTVIAFRSFD